MHKAIWLKVSINWIFVIWFRFGTNLYDFHVQFLLKKVLSKWIVDRVDQKMLSPAFFITIKLASGELTFQIVWYFRKKSFGINIKHLRYWSLSCLLSLEADCKSANDKTCQRECEGFRNCNTMSKTLNLDLN